MQSRTVSLRIITLVFLLFLFTDTPILANETSDNISDKFFQPHLLSKAKDQGKVAVIVKLNVNTRPVSTLSYKANAEQRRRIQRSNRTLSDKLEKFRPEHKRSFKNIPYAAMELDADALKAAMANPEVVEIYEDRLNQLSLADSTSLVGATVSASSGAGGAGQVVAILDTGVESSHPFLTGKVVHEACFSKTTSSSTSLCPNNLDTQTGVGAAASCDISGCSHGTHVAGIAAGKSTLFSGVAPEASIMAIQVFSRFEASDCNGSGPCVLAYTSDLISALDHIYSQRHNFNIASVNMSLGGGGYVSACDGEPIKAAIDLLKSAGIATVIASGNDSFSNNISYPACVSSAISVGATTKSDTVASYSNSADFLDLLAPGSSIESSIPGGQYANYSGTSMATPHVAGAFAALRSDFPAASVDKILGILKSTGSKVLDNRNNITVPRIQIDLATTALTPIPLITRHDFDPDGRADIFWRHSTKGSNMMHHMDGVNVVTESSVRPVADTRWEIAGIGDTDGDNDADILWRNATTGDTWMFLMAGHSVSDILHLIHAADLNWEIAGLADMDGNGVDDVIWHNSVTGENWLFLLNGNSIVQSLALPTVRDTNWEIAGIGDLNGDQKADLFWRNKATGLNWILLMDSATILTSSPLNTIPDKHWQVVGMADLNNDQKSDIIWRHAKQGLVWTFLMDSTRITTSTPLAVVPDSKWQIKQLSDFNGDGNFDILWRNDVTGENWVFLMEGKSIKQSSPLNSVTTGWEIISP